MASRLPSGCSCWQLPRPEVLRSQLLAAQIDIAHQHPALAPWRERRRRLHGSHDVSATDGRHRRWGRRRQDGDDSGSSSGREGSSGSQRRPPAQGDGAGAWEDLATDDEWEKVTISTVLHASVHDSLHLRAPQVQKSKAPHNVAHLRCYSGSGHGQKILWATIGRTRLSSPGRLGGGQTERSTRSAGHAMLTCGQ